MQLTYPHSEVSCPAILPCLGVHSRSCVFFCLFVCLCFNLFVFVFYCFCVFFIFMRNYSFRGRCCLSFVLRCLVVWFLVHNHWNPRSHLKYARIRTNTWIRTTTGIRVATGIRTITGISICGNTTFLLAILCAFQFLNQRNDDLCPVASDQRHALGAPPLRPWPLLRRNACSRKLGLWCPNRTTTQIRPAKQGQR